MDELRFGLVLDAPSLSVYEVADDWYQVAVPRCSVSLLHSMSALCAFDVAFMLVFHMMQVLNLCWRLEGSADSWPRLHDPVL